MWEREKGQEGIETTQKATNTLSKRDYKSNLHNKEVIGGLFDRVYS